RARRLAVRLWAAGLLCVGACTPLAPLTAPAASGPPPAPPAASPAPTTCTPLGFCHPAAPNALPISPDTVLRLTHDQHPKISQAGEKVNAARADKAAADKNWLPDLYLGGSAYRHEGGIQNEDGTLIHSSFGALFGGLEVSAHFDPREQAFQRVNAERKVWQQRAELSRTGSQKVLEASTAYVDLLAARAAEAVSRATERAFGELLDKAERSFVVDPSKEVDMLRIRTELAGQKRQTYKLRGQATAAAARLAYLLGIDPC